MKAQRAQGNITPLKSEKEIADSLERLLETLAVFDESSGESDIIYNLYQSVQKMVAALKLAKSDKQLDEAIGNFVECFDNLYELVKSVPVLQQQKLDFEKEVKNLQNRIQQLQTEAVQHKTTRLQAEQLLEEREKADWARLDRLAHQFGGIANSISESIQISEEEKGLAEKLAEVQAQRIKSLQEAISSLQKALPKIANTKDLLTHFPALAQVGSEDNLEQTGEQIEQKLGKLQEFLNDVRAHQVNLANEIDTIESELTALRDKHKNKVKRLDSEIIELETHKKHLEQYSDELIDLQKPVAKAEQKLHRFAALIKDLQSDELQEILLLQIPEIPGFKVPEASAEVKLDDVGEIMPERQQQLQKIGEKYQLTTKEVFVISLYEILKYLHISPLKAVHIVLKCAEKANVVQSFGWKNWREALESWTTADDEGAKNDYLGYRGKPVNSPSSMYWRTDKALDWNVYNLFTPKEIEAFTAAILEY